MIENNSEINIKFEPLRKDNYLKLFQDIARGKNKVVVWFKGSSEKSLLPIDHFDFETETIGLSKKNTNQFFINNIKKNNYLLISFTYNNRQFFSHVNYHQGLHSDELFYFKINKVFICNKRKSIRVNVKTKDYFVNFKCPDTVDDVSRAKEPIVVKEKIDIVEDKLENVLYLKNGHQTKSLDKEKEKQLFRSFLDILKENQTRLNLAKNKGNELAFKLNEFSESGFSFYIGALEYKYFDFDQVIKDSYITIDNKKIEINKSHIIYIAKHINIDDELKYYQIGLIIDEINDYDLENLVKELNKNINNDLVSKNFEQIV